MSNRPPTYREDIAQLAHLAATVESGGAHFVVQDGPRTPEVVRRSWRCALFGHARPLLYVWRPVPLGEVPVYRAWWECERCGRRSLWGDEL